MAACRKWVLAVVAGLAAAAFGDEGLGSNAQVYFMGNSLTRGLSLQRLSSQMFTREGGTLEYGSALSANLSLHEHWARFHDLYGEVDGVTFKINAIESYPFGSDYRDAFSKFDFDAFVMQPHQSWLETDPADLNAFDMVKLGDRIIVSNFISYCTGANPSNNVSTQRFFLYGTWPRLRGIHYRNPATLGDLTTYPIDHSGSYTNYTFADFYAEPYLARGEGTHVYSTDPIQSVPCRDFLEQLVAAVNADHPGLPVPVRLIPVGNVLAAIDEDIRNGLVPGLPAYFTRNASYYSAARATYSYWPIPSGVTFDPAYGVVNFYCDEIHLNASPHDSAADGTVGSYVMALTQYAVISGNSPIGLGVEDYIRLDSSADAELISYLQHKVWDVVTADPLTGVTAGILFTALPTISGGNNGNGSFTCTFTTGTAYGDPVPALAGTLTLDGVDVTAAMSGLSYTVAQTNRTQELIWTVTASNGVQPNVQETVTQTVPALSVVHQLTGDGADWTVGLNASGLPTKISNGAAATVNACDDNPDYNQLDECAILVFRLPDLGGATISSANLAVTWEADNMQSVGTGHPGSADTAMPKWVDLYAVRYAAANTVLTSDYGYKTVRAAGDTLIQTQFLYQAANVTMNTELRETSDSGDASLSAWLTAQIAAGAQAGDYVFLRIHGMQDAGNAWKINSGDASTGKPVLSIIATSGVQSSDSDGDGLPNDWETLYFGGATNANPNATAANGINTIYETYVAGLNPTNAQSVFSVSNGWNTLHWVAVSGRVYSVWSSTNLLGNFQPLETNILWPQNSWTGQMDEVNGFIRLKVELVP